MKSDLRGTVLFSSFMSTILKETTPQSCLHKGDWCWTKVDLNSIHFQQLVHSQEYRLIPLRARYKFESLKVRRDVTAFQLLVKLLSNVHQNFLPPLEFIAQLTDLTGIGICFCCRRYNYLKNSPMYRICEPADDSQLILIFDWLINDWQELKLADYHLLDYKFCTFLFL